MIEQVKRYDGQMMLGGTAIPAGFKTGMVTGRDYDALHAEAEALQRQVTELTNQRDAILLQARCWAGEAKAQQAITKAVGEALGGVPNWGPISAGVEALRAENGQLTQCLATANRQAEHFEREWYLRCDELEAARGLLAKAQLHLQASGHNLAADDIGRHLAETAAPAPEVRQFDKPSLLKDCNVTYSNSSRPLAEQGERQEPPPPAGLRKRFSEIEDEVALGKHNAMSCFTAMRTAALYTPQPGPDARGLAAFALELIDGAWEGGSFDGGDIQEAGVRHGLLTVEQRQESCGEHCDCAEYGFPAECYRLTPALAAHRQAQQGDSHDT